MSFGSVPCRKDLAHLLSSADSQRTWTCLFLWRLLPQTHELSAGAGLIQAADLQQEQQSARPGPSAGLADSPGRPPPLRVRHLQGVKEQEQGSGRSTGSVCTGRCCQAELGLSCLPSGSCWKSPTTDTPQAPKGLSLVPLTRGELASLCYYCHRNTVTAQTGTEAASEEPEPKGRSTLPFTQAQMQGCRAGRQLT